MPLVSEQVTIKRPARTASGKGGKVVTWSTSASGVECTVNYPDRRSAARLEAEDRAPGAAQKTTAVFFFDQDPSPTISRDWRIERSDSTVWTVMAIRTYEGPQLQVEAEKVV